MTQNHLHLSIHLLASDAQQSYILERAAKLYAATRTIAALCMMHNKEDETFSRHAVCDHIVTDALLIPRNLKQGKSTLGNHRFEYQWQGATQKFGYWKISNARNAIPRKHSDLPKIGQYKIINKQDLWLPYEADTIPAYRCSRSTRLFNVEQRRIFSSRVHGLKVANTPGEYWLPAAAVASRMLHGPKCSHHAST
ncbi:hypothetical protein MRB53_038549 [Persea americana]|nr:hypothetical protein MRB53_038549 [Persea americana]